MEAIDCGLKPSAKKQKKQGKQHLNVTQGVPKLLLRFLFIYFASFETKIEIWDFIWTQTFVRSTRILKMKCI